MNEFGVRMIFEGICFGSFAKLKSNISDSRNGLSIQKICTWHKMLVLFRKFFHAATEFTERIAQQQTCLFLLVIFSTWPICCTGVQLEIKTRSIISLYIHGVAESCWQTFGTSYTYRSKKRNSISTCIQKQFICELRLKEYICNTNFSECPPWHVMHASTRLTVDRRIRSGSCGQSDRRPHCEGDVLRRCQQELHTHTLAFRCPLR
jgi:hypothetical protein